MLDVYQCLFNLILLTKMVFELRSRLSCILQRANKIIIRYRVGLQKVNKCKTKLIAIELLTSILFSFYKFIINVQTWIAVYIRTFKY